MYSTISAAAILAAIPAVSAFGQAVVENHCNFPVYLWSVSDSVNPMQEIASNGGKYSESYRTNADGGGISIKISRDQTQNTVTQFEYTLTDSLWYDVSNINGYPFENWGLALTPSEDGCPNVSCPAGVAECSDAYNIPSDNHATSMCSTEATTVLVLCSSQGNEQPAAPAPAPAPTPSPVAVAQPATTAPPAVPTSAVPVVAAQVAPPSSAKVLTTLATHLAAAAAAPAATEVPADNDGPQWFGHHLAGWIPKAKRHEHHPHAHHARHA